eukprot:2176907-Prymnesium_polylepis.1
MAGSESEREARCPVSLHSSTHRCPYVRSSVGRRCGAAKLRRPMATLGVTRRSISETRSNQTFACAATKTQGARQKLAQAHRVPCLRSTLQVLPSLPQAQVRTAPRLALPPRRVPPPPPSRPRRSGCFPLTSAVCSAEAVWWVVAASSHWRPHFQLNN